MQVWIRSTLVHTVKRLHSAIDSWTGVTSTTSYRTDTKELISEIRESEPLIKVSRIKQVKLLILRLQEKLGQQDNCRFYLSKVKHHRQPLTGMTTLFITGGCDRTCKIWDTASGEGLHTLEGHRYVVANISTGSFDKTCRMWRAEMGKCMFGLWDVQTGEEVAGHSADIISLSFNTVGDQLVTGSFDHTVSLWDVPSGRRVHTLIGHRGEISSVQFDWDCSLLITGSMDKSSRVWEAASGHEDEVLDVCFDYTGQLIATASADGTARMSSAARLEGHEGEIPKVSRRDSADTMARLWDVQSGVYLQVMEGHTDEIFSSAFNYEGDTITGSKDNTCR
uniref:WD repeat-containing protein 69 n=1 Tax=Oncorhynchus mykiss TaxID=8022 RepID=A0A8C7UQ65_ONCMY